MARTVKWHALYVQRHSSNVLSNLWLCAAALVCSAALAAAGAAARLILAADHRGRRDRGVGAISLVL